LKAKAARLLPTEQAWPARAGQRERIRQPIACPEGRQSWQATPQVIATDSESPGDLDRFSPVAGSGALEVWSCNADGQSTRQVNHAYGQS
jgi:hypothetical protein